MVTADISISSTTSRLTRLNQQCIDRVTALVEELPKPSDQSVVSPTSQSKMPSLDVSALDPPDLIQCTPRVKEPSPLERAQRYNQQLMVAYRARMSKLRRDAGNQHTANLSLTLQRRLAENMAIAQAREQALAKKLQERQRRLQEEAAMRFASSTGMYKDEQERRQLYTEILEYEQDVHWLNMWRKKLKDPQQPANADLLQKLINQILRTPDHPLTQLIVRYQRQTYDKLQPILQEHQCDLREISRQPSCTSDSSTSLHISRSTSKHSIRSDSPQSLRQQSHSSSETNSLVLNVDGAPHSQSLASPPTGDYDVEDFDDLFDDGDAAHVGSSRTEDVFTDKKTEVTASDWLRDSEGAEHSNSMPRGSDNDAEDSNSASSAGHQSDVTSAAGHHSDVTSAAGHQSDVTSAAGHQSDVTSAAGHQSDVTSAVCSSKKNIEQSIWELEKEALERHVQNITQDVLSFLDKIQTMFIVAYEQLDSPEGRDLCYACIEEPFFRPVWRYLLALFRLANKDQEEVLKQVMLAHTDCNPDVVTVAAKFSLSSDNSPHSFPYESAVQELCHIPEYVSPLNKLECVVKVSKVICKCVEEFYSEQGEGSLPSIGADDLLPILSYVVLKSSIPQLISECRALEEFIHEGYLMGEEGYCLTSLQTALGYLLTLANGKAGGSGQEVNANLATNQENQGPAQGIV